MVWRNTRRICEKNIISDEKKIDQVKFKNTRTGPQFEAEAAPKFGQLIAAPMSAIDFFSGYP